MQKYLFLLLFCLLSLQLSAQSRRIPHITAAGGSFSTHIFIANDTRQQQAVTLNAYNNTGFREAVATRQVAANTIARFSIDELFPRANAVSHLTIADDSFVSVTISYQAKTGHSSPAHVNESLKQAGRWGFFPGDPDVAWDGIAVVNTGDAATSVTIDLVDEQGVVHASQTPEVLQLDKNGKGIYLLSSAFPQMPGTWYEVHADQPLALTALRGDAIASSFLWENAAFPLDDDASSSPFARRMIPHVTPATASFTTRIMLTNTSTAAATWHLTAYDENGLVLGEEDGTLAGDSMRAYAISELFPAMAVTNIDLTASDPGISAAFSYQANGQGGGPAHLGEASMQAHIWYLFPGNAEVVWDGVAVLNLGSERSEVLVELLDENGQVLQTERPWVLRHLDPNSRAVYTMNADFDIIPNTQFRLTAEEPVMVTALRGNLPSSTFLWENAALPQALDFGGRYVGEVTRSGTGGGETFTCEFDQDGILVSGTIRRDREILSITGSVRGSTLFFSWSPSTGACDTASGYGSATILDDTLLLDLDGALCAETEQLTASLPRVVRFNDPLLRDFMLTAYDKNDDDELAIHEAAVISKLDLRQKGLKDIEGLQYCINLDDLDLSENNITSMEPLRTLERLATLNLEKNKITHVPDLSGMTRLGILLLNNNKIDSMDRLGNLSSLKYLWLQQNRLTALPSLDGLTGLEALNCAGNRLTTLPALNAMASLRILDVGDNSLTELPDLSVNRRLSQLIASNNRLTELPDLDGLRYLVLLRCEYNSLETLPRLLHQVGLQTLTANNNTLFAIPDLSELASLKELNLAHNQLVALPEFYELKQLTSLDVSGNELGSLPPMSDLIRLRTLKAADNVLSYLPDMISVRDLEHLDVGNNLISTLPDISVLTDLRYLDLSNNLLSTLPSLSPFSYLETLIVHHNLLRQVPVVAYNSHLERLDISHNFLEERSCGDLSRAQVVTHLTFNPQTGGNLDCEF